MAFNLDNVVPWGRSLDEYMRMFDLSDREKDRRIVSCADGPASFNAQMHALGHRVVSVDPIYSLSAGEIGSRVEAARDNILSGLKESRDRYMWEEIPSPEELVARRLETVAAFLEDYRNSSDGRYVAGAFPALPFEEDSFDLALCSHFLFTYTGQVSEALHVSSVLEMCRVAREVRIFPLIDLDGFPSPHVEPIFQALDRLGYRVSLKVVPYEFQIGGDEMMIIQRAGV